MRTFYYEFADGHFFFNSGRLRGSDRFLEIKAHGAIVVEKLI